MSDEYHCPRCRAPFWHFSGLNTRIFECGSDAQIPSVSCKYASKLFTELSNQVDGAREVLEISHQRSNEKELRIEDLKKHIRLMQDDMSIRISELQKAEARVKRLETVMKDLVMELDAYLRPWNQPQKDPNKKARRLDLAEDAARFEIKDA